MPENSNALGKPMPRGSIAILLALLIFGIDATFGKLSRNGFSDYISKTMAGVGPQYLPDTEEILLTHYTGVQLIDKLFVRTNMLVSGFASQLHPEMSLYGFYMTGQTIAGGILFAIEGLRQSNSSSILSYTWIWLSLLLLFDSASIAPIFAILHLLLTHSRSRSRSSGNSHPSPDTVRLTDPWKLVATIPALVPSYLLPLALALAPFPDAAFRQRLAALALLSPLSLLFWRALATRALRRLGPGHLVGAPRAEADAAALRLAYDFALGIATATQLAALAWLACSGGRFTFAQAFLPRRGPDGGGVGAGATGAQIMHDFYKYDLITGSTAGIVWAATVLDGSCPEVFYAQGSVSIAVRMVGRLLLSGPGGTVVWLMKVRDEGMLAKELAVEAGRAGERERL